MSIEAINWAFKQEVKPTQKLVLIALANFADDHEICWPRINTISNMTCLSGRAIQKSLKELSDINLITRAERAGNRGNDSNVYRLHVSDKCISDHPLSMFVEGCTRFTPRVNEVQGGVNEVQGRGERGSPLEPLIEPSLNQKEKNTRSRDEFLRVIDKGFNAGDFKQWEHLTETEIMDAATACYDFHANRDGEYAGKDPVAGLRYWIRNGIKRGSVRKMVLQDKQADSPAKEYPNPEQVWQTNLKDRMQPAHWKAWIRPLWHDGDGKLCAPSQFIASEASKRHGDEIHSVLKGVEIIHQPYQQPQETMRNA